MKPYCLDTNTNAKSAAVLLLAGALLLGVGNIGLAQQSLTVSPAVTSNTYAGVITLTITGLTNGETVAIRKYLDLNANGSIDPGEPLMDAFKITDGGAMIIGGVTNINVPFDSNPVAGAITTTLNFPASMPLENIVGHQIIQLASPSGRFSPVNATFAVTNSTQSQAITGIIYSNGVPMPNGVVVVQDQDANNPAASAVADGSGRYFLTLKPGNYALISGMPNLYYDQSLAPSFILTNGIPATNNLFLTNGSVTISGTVYDSANSNALGGVLMLFQSGNLFAINFTDTNGAWSAALTPSFWKIEVVKERLARRAYLQPGGTLQVDTTTGAVANVGIPVPKGTALFHGRLTDSSSAPFANIQFSAGASGNNLSAKGYSDLNGYYAVAVVGDQTNNWSCQVDSGQNTALSKYVVNSFSTLTLSNSQTVQQDFVALPAIGQISGSVHDNSGNPVSGVTLTDSAFISGKNYQSLESTTDNQGHYSFGVAAGQWNLQFLTGGFQDNLDAHGYEDLSAPHVVNIPPTNVIYNFTVYPIGTPIISGQQRISSTQFGFLVSGASSVNYTVFASTNLSTTNWLNLFSFQLTTNPFPVVDTHATNKQRFYRVQKN